MWILGYISSIYDILLLNKRKSNCKSVQKETSNLVNNIYFVWRIFHHLYDWFTVNLLCWHIITHYW